MIRRRPSLSAKGPVAVPMTTLKLKELQVKILILQLKLHCIVVCRVSQQVLDEKLEFWIFSQKNPSQIEVTFSLFVTFSDFGLNSCLKLVGTPGMVQYLEAKPAT